MDVRALWELQEIDIALDRIAQDLADVDAALGEPSVLQELRKALDAVEATVQRLSVQQKDLELTLEGLNERLQDLQQRLYGGMITDPKEIAASQQKEAEMLRQRSTLEDELLEVMESLEASRAEVRTLQERLAQEEARWRRERDELLQRRDKLLADQRALHRQREWLVARLPGEILVTYQRLRQQKYGMAVARLDGQVCLACGVEVPVSVARQARMADQLIFCPTCGRILVA